MPTSVLLLSASLHSRSHRAHGEVKSPRTIPASMSIHTSGPAQATAPPLCWSQAVPHASSVRQKASGQGLWSVVAWYVHSPPAAHCCRRPYACLVLKTAPERCGVFFIR